VSANDRKKHKKVFNATDSHQILLSHGTHSQSYGPPPRLIWHHRTIEDVAAFDFCCAIE
jgi:hypothetical protein